MQATWHENAKSSGGVVNVTFTMGLFPLSSLHSHPFCSFPFFRVFAVFLDVELMDAPDRE